MTLQADVPRLIQALASLWPEADLAPLRRRLAEADSVALALDSRGVSGGGELFVALPGVACDGREFIAAALEQGAALVLAEADGLDAAWRDDARVLALPGLTERQSEFGRQLFAVPDSLTLIGVTGTNGKSSVTHYIATLLEAVGRPAAVIGTLGYGRPQRLKAARQTTPGPLELQQMLGELASEGVESVAMEVSSHALAQERLGDTPIAVAVFTNLSRDHLDYHGSMAAYAAAKAKLFRREGLRLAVVNADDPLTRLMLAGLAPGVRVLATGTAEATTLRVAGCEMLPQGLHAVVASPEDEHLLELPLMGRFNLDNALLAMATLYGLGVPLATLWPVAQSLSPVPGRMQRLPREPDSELPSVVIDYAHTPDALDNALTALRDHLPAQADSQLWCVFGCGGDRDSGKRPLMAAVAERHADRLVVTDDNPRSENPATIRVEIVAGLSPTAAADVWAIDGRGEAIRRVIAEAGPHDIVLIAGKGHEDYQEIAGVRHPFDDLEQARAACALREAQA
ncbi:UDP-N-acetylmuramoyl-L-alanyl-D-glutamate--2,6-diaminopimelate ligase [Salinicola endophyticus]|uniref:UDP-N-acetylmuramoyl-L-alanyl-D-glutamate--2,6-diaminopimelate ligase n=1 Tax=Salinicola endophyticus TaxID=1949083 RepID=A0AB74UE94_9GAMM